jgi:anaphase-promoting complex subunit 3
MDINESATSQPPRLHARFASLIWEFLDAGLSRTAVFYSERFFALDNTNHVARHLYCRALFEGQQYYSALALVNQDRVLCGACCELKARCCSILGRHRQAREALEQTMHLPSLGPLCSSRILSVIDAL